MMSPNWPPPGWRLYFPAEPLSSAGERPPNSILIVADDLGYSDISTFGGGVDGRLQTPGIDRLAAAGHIR